MTQGIAASQFVSVIPGVLSAGGQAVDLNGVVLTNSTRVPIGTVLPFPTLASVQAYFGASSDEATLAGVYFLGYDNSLQKPGSLLFAQYPTAAVPAFLRGGSLASMTLAQLKALSSGTITITIDGAAWTSGSIDLSTATSFSNAASIIQTALAANDGAFTGTIAPAASAFTGVIAITTGILTASSVTGPIVPGATVSGGTTPAGTVIVSQLTGTPQGAGTYQTNITTAVGSASLTSSLSGSGVLNVASALTGFVALGQVVAGAGVTAGTTITQVLFGSTNGLGNYLVSNSLTISSQAFTTGATVVTYDSTSSAFVLTGGTPGATNGAIAFPTTAALATSLKLTQATGAVISQGADAQTSTTVSTFMANVLIQTQNWIAFTTSFEPDLASKEAFAAWTNSTADDYAYIMWSTDVLDTETPNTGSAWAAIQAADYAGTFPIYAPVNQALAGAFVLSFGACLDFGATNGRATAAFKAQTGLPADVTSTAIAAQLTANGLSYYGAVQTRNPNNNFTFLANGFVSGPFDWYDSYLDQVWMNDNIVVTLLKLLTTIGSIPYNAAGYAMLDNVIASGPVAAALKFGAIRSGVPLSATQTAYVNNAAGANVAAVIQETGWYLLIQPAAPSVRQARTSPPMTLFYTDGQSIQKISLQSLEVA